MTTDSTNARSPFLAAALVAAAMAVSLAGCGWQWQDDPLLTCSVNLTYVPPPFSVAPEQIIAEFPLHLSADATPTVTGMRADGAGGILLFGTALDGRPWVGRFDGTGQRQWDKAIDIDLPVQVATATSDGGVVVVASALADDPTLLVAVWLSADGTPTETAELPLLAGLSAVAATEDHGLLVAGTRDVLRVNAAHKMVWRTAMEPDGTGKGQVVHLRQFAARPDGSGVVAYWTREPSDWPWQYAAKALRFNSSGAPLWRHDHDANWADLTLLANGEAFVEGAGSGWIQIQNLDTGVLSDRVEFATSVCEYPTVKLAAPGEPGNLDVLIERNTAKEDWWGEAEWSPSYYLGHLGANLKPEGAFAIDAELEMNIAPVRLGKHCLALLTAGEKRRLLRVPTVAGGCDLGKR